MERKHLRIKLVFFFICFKYSSMFQDICKKKLHKNYGNVHIVFTILARGGSQCKMWGFGENSMSSLQGMHLICKIVKSISLLFQKLVYQVSVSVTKQKCCSFSEKDEYPGYQNHYPCHFENIHTKLVAKQMHAVSRNLILEITKKTLMSSLEIKITIFANMETFILHSLPKQRLRLCPGLCYLD